MAQPALIGSIEAGGTKFVCAVGTGPDDYQEVRFATREPAETLREAGDFFTTMGKDRGAISALGIGTFGPADVDPKSATYGQIKNTPKPGWRGADLVGAIREALGSNIPVVFDTDVNAAAWGERRWGAARGIDDFVYITVGTGIGGGVVSGGRLIHGAGHPEIGHLRIPHDVNSDPYPGSCPFHRDCLEGLTSGTSIANRWGQDPRELPADHRAWEITAGYLADALANLSMTLAPSRFVLGGGVMDQSHLFPMIRKRFTMQVAGYLELPPADGMIVPPELGERAGALGGIAMAADALTK